MKSMRIFRSLSVASGIICLLTTSPALTQSLEIKWGNVIGPSEIGDMPHHMHQTQHDYAKLVQLETDGKIQINVLQGKRADIPVFRLPAMAEEGDIIQAAGVPPFFLTRVPELKVFEIPYLFRDKEHARQYPSSRTASRFAALIESRYDLKVLGQFLVAHHVAITSTDRPIVSPEDFAGRYVNDDFESFAPMWADIKPAKRCSIGYVDAVEGALHREEKLDTSIGMLQNLLAQNQHTKFSYANAAPAFYTFFYTFIMNVDTWNSLQDAQQEQLLSAAAHAEQLAFENEQATALHHRAINSALGIEWHDQTQQERERWENEFSGKVRDGILKASGDSEALVAIIHEIRDL